MGAKKEKLYLTTYVCFHYFLKTNVPVFYLYTLLWCNRKVMVSFELVHLLINEIKCTKQMYEKVVNMSYFLHK